MNANHFCGHAVLLALLASAPSVVGAQHSIATYFSGDGGGVFDLTANTELGWQGGGGSCTYLFGGYYCGGASLTAARVDTRLYAPGNWLISNTQSVDVYFAEVSFPYQAEWAGSPWWGVWYAESDHYVKVENYQYFCVDVDFDCGCPSNFPYPCGASSYWQFIGMTSDTHFVDEPPPPPSCPRSTHENALASNFQVRAPDVKSWHDFAVENNTFSFSVSAYSSAVADRDAIINAFSDWNGIVHSECDTTFNVAGGVTQVPAFAARLFVYAESSLGSNCGTMVHNGISERDEISIVTTAAGGSGVCTSYRETIARHEFGHLLGFELKNQQIHAVQDPTDIMHGTVGPGMSIKPRHARILVEEYSGVLQ